MKVLTLLLFAIPIWCQNGQPVRVQDTPPTDAVEKVYVITGTVTTAICSAMSSEGSRLGRPVAISAVSKANPAVITSTGHGFTLPPTTGTGQRPQVIISGATGTGWTAINATWTATIIDANTFSIPIDSTGFGTLAGTVIFVTPAPRQTIAEWAVQKFGYDGANNAIWSGWIGGTTAFNQKCTDVTSTTVVQQ
jgi:hypothetical protein